MKLKKVISLVLGGVMALTMLTACGSDDTNANTEVEVSSTNEAAEIVSYIEDYNAAYNTINKSAKLNTDLSGTETTDLYTAYARMSGKVTTDSGSGYSIQTPATAITNVAANQKYVILVEKTEKYSTKDIGEWVAKGFAETTGTKKIVTATAFEASLTEVTAGTAGEIEGIVTTTTTGKTKEYWVIVINT